jgi:hypothetical protein
VKLRVGVSGEASENILQKLSEKCDEIAILQAFSRKVDHLLVYKLSNHTQSKLHESNGYCQY